MALPVLQQIQTGLEGCARCGLCQRRNTIVFGEGAAQAKIMFVGEAPGAEEDRTGRPFIGMSGRLLTTLLEQAGVRREEVYITSVIKCRPPDNRKPKPLEVAACLPFLVAQIEAIKPRVIVTLGTVPTQTLLQTKTAIGELRGKWQQYRGIPLMPTFHPAYLLRSRKQIPIFVSDFALAKTRAEQLAVAESRATMAE